MYSRVVGGRYELTTMLGRGGMGEVWVATDQRIGRNVAIKMLHGQMQSQSDIDRFLREAQTAGRLNHPNVVTIHDIGHDEDGSLYLVMELLDGRDLAAVLRAGLPNPMDVAGWAAQLTAGLAAAHAVGVVHHDLKPANAMLTGSGTVKILDFGIARFASGTTQASVVVGSVAYLAPERLEGKVGDARSDLYSLGCLLYELIAGVPPFAGASPGAVMMAQISRPPDLGPLSRPGVPPDLRSLISELLAKDPDRRPASAHGVHARLNAILAGAAAHHAAVTAPHPEAATATAQPPQVLWSLPTAQAHQTNQISAEPYRQPAAEPATARKRRRTRAVLLIVGALVLVAAGVTTYVELSGPKIDSITAAQLQATCESMYGPSDDNAMSTSECTQIANCYASQLTAITNARYQAVYTYNLNGTKPAPPLADQDLVHSAEKYCESALPSSLSAYIDGVAGDT